jgi:fatty acid desaturase
MRSGVPTPTSGPVLPLRARSPRPAGAYVSSYSDLARAVRAAGLMRRRYGYYWTAFVTAAAAFSAVAVGVVLLRNTWYVVTLAPALALVCAQLGFLGHDAAHRQVFSSAHWNEWAARVISGVFAGLSYGWWLSKHNRHHSGPNQEGRDPDIAPGVFALTPASAATRTGWAAALTRRQGWWFFALLPFEGVNLHLQSVIRVASRSPMPRRSAEATFLAVRLGGYLAALFLLLPVTVAAVFLAVQLTVFGVLLGGAFTPNHIGMPIVPAEARPDFLRRQVLMSRNISGGRVVGFFLGGLQHQIEHHLFPSMPRPALAQARALVRAHCAGQQIHYEETRLWAAYARVARYLNAVGRADADPFRCPLVTLYRGGAA